MSAINYLYNYVDKTDINKLQKIYFINYIKAYYKKIIEGSIKHVETKNNLSSYIDTHFSNLDANSSLQDLGVALEPKNFWTHIYYIIMGKPHSPYIFYEWRDYSNVIHESGSYSYFANSYSLNIRRKIGDGTLQLYSYMGIVIEWLLLDLLGRMEAWVYNTKIPTSIWVGPVTTDHLIGKCLVPRNNLNLAGIGSPVSCRDFKSLHAHYEVDLSIPPFNTRSHNTKTIETLFRKFSWGVCSKVKGYNYEMYRESSKPKLGSVIKSMGNKDTDSVKYGNDYSVFRDLAILHTMCMLKNVDILYDVQTFTQILNSENPSIVYDESLLCKCFLKDEETTSLMDLLNYLF